MVINNLISLVLNISFKGSKSREPTMVLTFDSGTNFLYHLINKLIDRKIFINKKV